MRFRPLLLLMTVLALAAAGCQGGGEAVDLGDAAEDTGTGAGGGAPATEDGGGGDSAGATLVAAISSTPDQLDPHLTSAYASFQILENVYDTLVEPDDALEMVSALAESWETSDDQLSWTFTLREGVTFHDGSELTADDVVYSMDRIAEEGANAFRLDGVEEVTAVDDATVEFQLSRPVPNLLSNLGAFKGLAILPEGAADEVDLATEANGTGPFRLASYSETDGAVLEANEEYWGEVPSLGGVEFRFISEPTAALTALENGEVDWTDNVPPQQIEPLADSGDLVLGAVPSNDYWYLAPNAAREPFDDPLVRQAIAHGIDREAVTAAARFDAATPNQTAIPEGNPYHFDYAPYERDPERARELLEEAGATDVAMDLMVTDEYPESIQAAQVIDTQLAEVGIDVEIRTLDFATWLDEQAAGTFDAFMLSWLGNIDPDDFYYAQHVTDGAFNFQGYSNPEVDEALDAAREESEEDARRELYEEAVTTIVDEASYVYLYNPDVVHAWSPRLSGYEPRVDRAIRFRDVSLDG